MRLGFHAVGLMREMPTPPWINLFFMVSITTLSHPVLDLLGQVRGHNLVRRYPLPPRSLTISTDNGMTAGCH